MTFRLPNQFADLAYLQRHCTCIPCRLLTRSWEQSEDYVDTDDADVLRSLTTGEEHMLNLLAQGLANKEIAVTLGLSDSTVKNHMTIMLRKMHVHDRTQAAIMAWQLGLISRVVLESQ